MIISISELQKNISILGNLKEPLLVKDKRKNRIVAKIVPVEDDRRLFDELFGEGEAMEPREERFDEVYGEYLRERYGSR